MAVLGARFSRQRSLPLLELGIAVGSDSMTEPLSDASLLEPGYRVLRDTSGARSEVSKQAKWLKAGSIPRYRGDAGRGMTRDALLDLHVLTRDQEVTVAGWDKPWHYVWPRDLAFVISAFSRTGHFPEAIQNLAFLQSVQEPSGSFESRYRPDSGVSPDARQAEADGPAWALWGLAEATRQLGPRERAGVVTRFSLLLSRSTQAILASLSADGLPQPSPDYWEVRETRTTLPICAAALFGLQSSVFLYETVGNSDEAARVAAEATGLEVRIQSAFAARGYPRHADESSNDVDLGVTFLQAPFARLTRGTPLRVWAAMPGLSKRPAGGFAPGGGWRTDGISWTPTVATYAVTAACVDPPTAAYWLRWLDAHRTRAGALPEKVLANGAPASVAPLAWTAAAVIISADELSRGCPDGAEPADLTSATR